MAGTAKDMVDWYRKHLGMGEPSGGNYVQRTFRKHNDIGNYNWPWCQATVAVAANETGSFDEVMFGKWDAYTVTAAQRFKSRGQWMSGTTANVNKAKPGDIVYFDWSGSNDIGAIDHVGIVEKALGGGRVQTLEGNSGDRLVRRVRSSGEIAGFGRPKYAEAKAGKPSAPAKRYWDVVYPHRYDGKYDGRVRIPFGGLGPGDKGPMVASLQDALNVFAGGHQPLKVDGDFGEKTEKALKAFQRNPKVTDENGHKLDIDGEYGTHSSRALYKYFGGKV